MTDTGEAALEAGADSEAAREVEAHMPDEAELNRLLGELLERPEEWDRIVDEIDRTFKQTKAIMVLDMSGFSRTTVDRGITPFLLMIHQMQLLTVPSVLDHGGVLVKSEADNLYCIFDSVEDGVAASREIAMRLETANLILPKDRKLYASIGIGFGEVLNIGNRDLWGSEMNLACKLGEDIAELGDVLLSDAAMTALSDSNHRFEKHTVSVSGLELTYHALQ